MKIGALVVLAAVLVAYLAAMVWLGRLRDGFANVPIHKPASSGPVTWVVVGEDYPDPGTVIPGGNGTRADIIILITKTATGVKVTSIPRDAVVSVEGWQRPDRLTLSWLKGPQVFVNTLCTGFGIPVDHIVRVTAKSLEEVIDGLGGIDVVLDKPLRSEDQFNLPAGTVHLDGEAALKFARSRHAEVFDNGTWSEVSDGPVMRQRDSSQVFSQILAKAKAHPGAALSAVRTAAPDIGLDPEAGWLDMLPLAGFHGHIDTLPIQTKNETTALITADTRAAVSALGYHGCTP